MTQGMKVSKPGEDVSTADDDDLVYSSEFNTLKDHLSGLVSYTVSSPETKNIITHNLGYIPAFKIFYDNDDGIWHDCGSYIAGMFVGPTYSNAIAYSTSVSLYIKLGAVSSITYNVRYFIFKNNSI